MEDFDPSIPRHVVIRRFLEGKIRVGLWAPGALLPTEPELMQQFDVSRGTVRKAYDALVSSGLVVRTSGRGSFVRDSAPAGTGGMTIGLVIFSPNLFENRHNPVNWEMNADKLNGVLGEASALGVGIELIPYSPELLKSHREHAGFVMLGEFPDLIEMLEKQDRRPYAIILEREGRIDKGVNFCLKTCFQESIRFLLGHGHKRIGFVGLLDDLRLQPYRLELKRHGLTYDRKLVEEAAVGSPEDGYEATRRLFIRSRNTRSRPDAVFCTTDLRALGALAYLHEQGIKVPEEVSVMGFDNIKASAISTPPLTTYETPRMRCGQKALQDVVQQVRNPNQPQPPVVLPGKLVVRASVALLPEGRAR